MKDITIKIRKRTCKYCGQEFVSNGLKFCSEQCRTEKEKINKKELFEKTKLKAAEGKEKLSIAEINMLALAEHISYGQYVTKYGL